MKKTNKFFIASFVIIACVSTTFLSCKKVVSLPQVSVESISYYGLDTVIGKGKIISTGNGDITAEGFMCSTNPDFSNYSPQIGANGTQASFSTLIPATHYLTYYFKAYATNSKGTAYSSVVKFTVPPPPPATAPCTLANNAIMDNGGTFAVSVYNNPAPTWGNYEIDFSGTNETVYAYFFDLPHNGIYTTVGDPSEVYAGQVSIGITNFYTYTVNSGQKVYVALDTTNHKTIITFCSLSYSLNGLGTVYLSGKGTY